MTGEGDEVVDGRDTEAADTVPTRQRNAGGDEASRRPGRVPETEPDYRFTLANERTFLAWMRTALALLAGGIALRELVEPFDVPGSRTGLALAAVSLSLVLAVASYWRWHGVRQAMRRNDPLPHPIGVPLLATAITVVAAVSAVLLVLS